MLASRVVVVGASAGGVPSLMALANSLPADLNAAVLIVLHISSNYVSNLPEILSRCGPLPAKHPVSGERIKAGAIYIAPPDHHLLIERDSAILARGPKGNRNRPSVDALFRSAAYEFGPNAIGIILSGSLDDGTSGLWSIKRLGGTSIVQDPDEAQFDSMPSNAIQQVKIDHCLKAADMGRLLQRLIQKPHRKKLASRKKDRNEIGLEVSIATDGDAFKKGVMNLGFLSPFTCPECAGVLFELKGGPLIRYRCHTGHAYTSSALLSEVMDKVDSSYWEVMRSLEEASLLLDKTGEALAKAGEKKAAKLFCHKAKEAEKRSRQLREFVLTSERFSDDSLRKESALQKSSSLLGRLL